MKVAIYCRVSTEEQKTENQKLRLEEYAEKRGWEFVTFEEVESSRKTRPIKQIVLNGLRKKNFDAVLVYKLDRWARSSKELLLEIDELVKKGVAFISYSENLDLNNSMGTLMFQILAAFAEFERNIIRERTMEGLARAKAEGRVGGRPKGSKDSKPRKKGGYYLRHMNKK